MINPILMAIPFFFITMGIEYYVSKKKGLALYRLNDSISNLGCGVSNQIISVLLTGGMIALYTSVFENYSIQKLSATSPIIWIFTFFAVDFAYYWWHRASHRINFLWAIHGVHHQSEEYNLSVALRQAMFSPPSSLIFNIPLAVLGIPPVCFFTCSALNTLYQYWIHTELIKKLSILEQFMNTPSHHRVHHAINLEYLDKNYAGVFIVWDRIFGTYIQEQTRPVYGVVTPLRSWSVFSANFRNWCLIVQNIKNWGWNRVAPAIFSGPEYSPNGKNLPPPGQPIQVKFDVHPSDRLYSKLFWGLCGMLGIAFAFLIVAPGWSFTYRVLGSLFVLFIIWLLTAALERKPNES